MAKPLVLDLHIPYCIRPENYLAHFNAVGSNAEKNAYMDALKREVLSYEGELDGYEIRAVHLSGGSASVMAPDLLGDVLRTVRTHLPVAQGAEVSYDSLPVTIGTPSLTGIASGHPNRTELMMRSDNDAELKALGCTHNAQHIRNAMLFLAKFHLNNVGLTLNYGIPGQTMQSWHNSLHAAVIMQAGHITAEPLAVTDAEGMPNAAERFEMFRYACEYLPENGYKMYAAGCFARPGYEYRARAMEWNGDDVIGMGVNGGSVYDGYAVRNTNSLKLYIKNAGDFEKLTAQAAQLDENALMLRYLRGRMTAWWSRCSGSGSGRNCRRNFPPCWIRRWKTAWPSARPTAGCLPWKDCSGAKCCKTWTEKRELSHGRDSSRFLCSKSPTACRFVVYW